MPTVKTGVVDARGLRFHALEAGAGPLALCLHGFPDPPSSFREQLPALAAAGYRAVAPFMRGYGPTGPAPDGHYDVAALALDAVALIEALGYEDAVVLGHDWGALAAYGAALAAPRRVRKLVAASVPYGPQMIQSFTTSYVQARRSWYMFFFLTPLAATAVAHDDFAFLEHLIRDWSPGWRWAPQDLVLAKEALAAPGCLDAALGYYRAAFNPTLQDAALLELQGRIMIEPITVPTLYLHGADDGCIGAELVPAMAPFFPNGVQIEVLPGAGHFVHRERAESVNRLVLEFLRA